MTSLKRSLGLGHATAINMIDMVGIGPFITLPMVIGMMNGPYFLYAWLAGAALSIVDAMIWSELGAAFPKAGGSYNFLKEAYGSNGAGKLMSFLFVWQTMIQAPLVIASAAIGFAKYFSYLVPLDLFTSKIVSGSLVILIIFLLYRKIETIGKISVLLWSGVIITMFWIIGGGIVHGNFLHPITHINDGIKIDYAFVTVIGFASVKTVYSYLGYYNICHLGGEIKDPSKNIPRSMFLSIACISVLYLMMNISVVSVVPWQVAKDSEFVVSVFVLVASVLAVSIQLLKYLRWPGVSWLKKERLSGSSARHSINSALSFTGLSSASIFTFRDAPFCFLIFFLIAAFNARIKSPLPMGSKASPAK